MVTRCYLCGGSTAVRRVTVENWWGDALALVENVPAAVCEECGEVYLDAETCRALDRLRQAPPREHRTLEVPVYVLDERKAA
ncbi:MAG: type II toxin-antitoxin system MqsA family antitoxin [Armatimonadetes bacterium]|nr:type II toxin-antitoxin system MqsA family antitoxin [Armatimonadota bacterium]